jgi:ABC-type transporter Mla subunit MlaD
VRRRGFTPLASSPTAIGSVTVLITILAVFLAYNANSGLPFVPTYRITAQLPNAAELVPGNEVRIAGLRIGLIESIDPVRHDDGTFTAELGLKLDQSAAGVPEDSTVIVRTQSALGLKYLEIVKGDSAETFPEGAVLPLSAARPEPVDFDQVLNMFDAPTRAAIRVNEVEFGDALAGRGLSLNAGLAELAPAIERLEPVMRNLASPKTALERFIRALGATAAEVAPVAEVQARMFEVLDTTFGALAEVARPYIQQTIVRTPPTLTTATETLPGIRTFVGDSATLFAELQPGVDALDTYAPTIASSLEVGAPVLADSPELNAELEPTAQSLLAFSRDSGVVEGIEVLTEASGPLGSLLRFVAPAQSVCNYATILFENTASLLSAAGGSGGSAQRFIVFDIPKGPNNEGSPSSAPANGPDEKNFLHVNPYPNTAAPGQPFECEAGNEPFAIGQQVIGNSPGNQGTVTHGQEGSQ